MKTQIKTLTSEDEKIFKNYELFLNDLLYLKDLKKYFDDEIYTALMQYHYFSEVEPPSHSTPTSGRTNGIHVNIINLGTDDEDSGHGSLMETDDSRVFHKVNHFRKKKSITSSKTSQADDEIKYKETVVELRSILHKWDGLLCEDTLDLNDFDPDSYHELMQFSNYSQFEALLRLVPDIFSKCYKSIDLAKAWLRLSNSVMQEEQVPILSPIMDSPEPEIANEGQPGHIESAKMTKEFIEQVTDIKKQIDIVDRSITDDASRLHRYNREMDVLVGRDERVSTVSSKVDTIESLITLVSEEYHKSKTEQHALATKMRACRKGTPTYTKLKTHLKTLDTEVAQNHWKIKQLEFERTMVTEDLLVEAEVRPSIIRFIGDTKEKMCDLEKLLQLKRDEKLKLEKQLALMKTNTERMREIMRSRPTTGEEVSRESSLMSTPSDLDVSQIPLLDGNEADDDSSGPYDKTKKQHGGQSKQSTNNILLKQQSLNNVRPASERINTPKQAPLTNSERVARNRPKASKITPKRVWEHV